MPGFLKPPVVKCPWTSDMFETSTLPKTSTLNQNKTEFLWNSHTAGRSGNW
jgi:hypothetical protein